MRGEKPINLRKLQDEVHNKKNMLQGAKVYFQEDDLEKINVYEAEYQEAAERLMALPPPPVLPPIHGLYKLTGRLEAFSRLRCEADFEVDFYRTNPLPNASDTQRLAGGLALTAAGSPALGALLAAEDKPRVSTADYIRGQINGMPFRGWVGMTDLKIGDEVEIVAEWQSDHYEVYAIAYPAERIISVCPQCDMGSTAYGWLRVKYMLITFVFFVSVFFFIMPLSLGETYSEGIMKSMDMNRMGDLWGIILSMVLLFSAAIAISAYKAYAPTTCKLAEDIFRTMGWEWGEQIDLNQTTAQHERKLKREKKWYSPRRKDKPLRPTRKFIGAFEYWYYY